MGRPPRKRIDQPVGVMHFLDRFLVLMLGQLADAPVLEHARVQEVLVDRCQFVLEAKVQELDDFGVAFHGALLRK